MRYIRAYFICDASLVSLKKQIEKASFTGKIVEEGKGASGATYVKAKVQRNKLLELYLKEYLKKNKWIVSGSKTAETGTVYVDAVKELEHNRVRVQFRISNHHGRDFNNTVNITNISDIEEYFKTDYKEKQKTIEWEGAFEDQFVGYLKMKGFTYSDIKKGRFIRTAKSGFDIYKWTATITVLVKE